VLGLNGLEQSVCCFFFLLLKLKSFSSLSNCCVFIAQTVKEIDLTTSVLKKKNCATKIIVCLSCPHC